MYKIIHLELTLKQLETLSEKLNELWDEGIPGAGWASSELEELRSLVDEELSKHTK